MPAISNRLAMFAATMPLLTLAACGTAPTSAADEASATSAPIVIDHAYGTLELDEAPKKIVTLGLLETDIAVDLDIAPVAMGKFFATPDGVAPWLSSELEETPEIIDTTTQGADGAELDIESLAEMAPDLIIANTYSQLDKYYDQLSQIAPVLGPSDKNYLQLPWREQTLAIAEALGKPDAGAELIAATENELADAVEQNPVTAGHDYTLSLATPDQIKVMNDPEDSSVEVLEAFGLTFSEDAASLPSLDDGSGAAAVSEEDLGALDADVVMIGFFGADTQQRWESSTLFQNIPAVKNGGLVPLDLSASTALRNPSPLSIGYVIDEVIEGQVVPALQK